LTRRAPCAPEIYVNRGGVTAAIRTSTLRYRHASHHLLLIMVRIRAIVKGAH
jgi:hypothetical protein